MGSSSSARKTWLSGPYADVARTCRLPTMVVTRLEVGWEHRLRKHGVGAASRAGLLPLKLRMSFTRRQAGGGAEVLARCPRRALPLRSSVCRWMMEVANVLSVDGAWRGLQVVLVAVHSRGCPAKGSVSVRLRDAHQHDGKCLGPFAVL